MANDVTARAACTQMNSCGGQRGDKSSHSIFMFYFLCLQSKKRSRIVTSCHICYSFVDQSDTSRKWLGVTSGKWPVGNITPVPQTRMNSGESLQLISVVWPLSEQFTQTRTFFHFRSFSVQWNQENHLVWSNPSLSGDLRGSQMSIWTFFTAKTTVAAKLTGLACFSMVKSLTSGVVRNVTEDD